MLHSHAHLLTTAWKVSVSFVHAELHFKPLRTTAATMMGTHHNNSNTNNNSRSSNLNLNKGIGRKQEEERIEERMEEEEKKEEAHKTTTTSTTSSAASITISTARASNSDSNNHEVDAVCWLAIWAFAFTPQGETTLNRISITASIDWWCCCVCCWCCPSCPCKLLLPSFLQSAHTPTKHGINPYMLCMRTPLAMAVEGWNPLRPLKSPSSASARLAQLSMEKCWELLAQFHRSIK